MMNASDKKYEFSVIMSIYQVKAYLDEAIASLLKQTIGFDCIQLILVDDGSTDGSEEICDSYKQKYPEKVTVIHKPNGGLSSARNAGLPYVQGKYVSFFDPDDILDRDVFAKVSAFMHEHEDETDVCCIPYFMFGTQEGPHPLNYKFDKGTRVIDLLNDEDADCIVLSAATSFYKAEIAKQMHFDTEMVTAEDAKENLRIFLRNPHLGVVADTRYHYRRYIGSILNKSKQRYGWYTPYLKTFSNWALDEAQKIYGYVPKFVQHVVMYDLQWKLLQDHIDDGALTEQESKEYQKLLLDTCMRIDDDVIASQQCLDEVRKIYLLDQKHPDTPCRERDRLLHEMSFIISFMRFNDDHFMIEGMQRCMDIAGRQPSYFYTLNDGPYIPMEKEDYHTYHYIADIPIMRNDMFKVTVPLKEADQQKRNRIRFYYCYGNNEYLQSSVATDRYAPVDHLNSASYWIKENHLVQLEEGAISLTNVGKHHFILKLHKEMVFLWQLARMKKKEAYKAIFCRLSAYIGRLILPKDIWLITDKADRADDNGEAFFRYLVSLGKQAKCHPYFVISDRSSDYSRMAETGKVIPYMSWRHKIMHLIAKHTVSAYSFDEISSPFLSRSHYYGDMLQDNKIIFLQHGITKDDVSVALNRSHKNYRLFVTAAPREYESIIQGNYGYDTDQVVLTGFTRYDRLHDNRKKYITIMPTWASDLVGRNIPEEGRRELLPGFEQSDYYQFYTGLLNNQKLLKTADKLGYKIRFLVHPVFIPYVDRFKFDERVEVLHKGVHYNEIFAESALITTDYSSVFFDFAYLNKPVIYTQFSANHYEKGYFDYERDGFGEVEHTIEGSIDRLIEYMQNDCQLKEKYRERINSFFAYHDHKNCERVYHAILRSEQND